MNVEDRKQSREAYLSIRPLCLRISSIFSSVTTLSDAWAAPGITRVSRSCSRAEMAVKTQSSMLSEYCMDRWMSWLVSRWATSSSSTAVLAGVEVSSYHWTRHCTIRIVEDQCADLAHL